MVAHAHWFVLLALILGCGPAKPEPPSIRLSTGRIDLARMVSGETTTASFRIRNAGGDTLRISEVRTSCGCTKTGPIPERIAPGDSVALDVRFDSRGFTGITEKRVVIRSNDPLQPLAVITLVADVFHEMELVSHRGMVLMNKLKAGRVSSVVLVFRNRTPLPITVIGMAVPDGSIRARLTPQTVAPGRDIQVRLDVTPMKRGFTSQELYLDLKGARQPRVPVRLVYSV